MAFGIAGADDVEVRFLFFDEGYEVAGMFKDVSPFAARYFVAAQGQDVFDARFLSFAQHLADFIQVLQGCFCREVDAGHMGRRFAA